MYPVRLTLTDFRSHADFSIDVGDGLVALAGENGVGKTNILEALSLLAPGRGLRQAALSEIARSAGLGGFAVAARLSGDVEIGTGTVATAPERRQVRINGTSSSANALGERISLLWLTPAMDRLFLEGASGRRRFLDRLVLAREPSHALHATRYEAAMRARNRLLVEADTPDPDWLRALELGMAEHGIALAEARARTIADLAIRLVDVPKGPFARGILSLEGWENEGAEQFASSLAASRTRDAGAGRTGMGPHRQDLAVVHLEKGQPAARSSTGEQKALLLSIILAHADVVAAARGSRPVLLLDEVAAHLDPVRRHALFDRLSAAGGQIWMTGTEIDLFRDAPPGTQRFSLAATGSGRSELLTLS